MLKRSLARASIPIIALGGALARVLGLGAQSFWYDEVVSREVATGSLFGLLGRISTAEGSPPLYYIVLAIWGRVFGFSELALRSFSALVGSVTVAVGVSAVHKWGFDRKAQRSVALLLAFNPFLVWYSQEARSYALLTLFGSLALLGLARTQTQGSVRDFALVGAALAGAVLTHYFAVFFAIGLLIVLGGTVERNRRLLYSLLPPIAAGTVLLPLAISQRATGQQDWITEWSLNFRLDAAMRHLLLGPSIPWSWVVPFIAITFVIATVPIFRIDEPRKRIAARSLLVVGICSIGIPMLLATVGFDYFLDRNVVLGLIPLLMVAAIGIALYIQVLVRTCLASVLVVFSIASVFAVVRDSDMQRADYRSLAATLDAGGRPDIISMNSGRVPMSALRGYIDGHREIGWGSTAYAQDVAFIGLDPVPGRCDWWYGRACSIVYLSAEPPQTMPHVFRLVGIDRVDRFVITRYHAEVPVALEPAFLIPPGDEIGSLVFELFD